MLEIDNCCMVVVDVQGKLAQLMHEKEILFANIQILIKSAKILNIPILWCQQVPKALGPTLPEIAELLSDIQPLNKASFSCFGDAEFKKTIKKLSRREVILCGIETHVCIYQTAADLQRFGHGVTVIADAVSSRAETNKKIAINKMRTMGIDISSTEMLLFELMRTAEHPKFREVAKLVK